MSIFVITLGYFLLAAFISVGIFSAGIYVGAHFTKQNVLVEAAPAPKQKRRPTFDLSNLLDPITPDEQRRARREEYESGV